MAGNRRWSLNDDEESPELYDESLLLEVEKATETDDQPFNSSPDRGFSSGSFSHWSRPCSKPTEVCRNAQEPQFLQNSAQVVTEFSPLSSLSKNADCAVIGAGLENLGNTCFLNSVLQCFIHTVPLLQPIMSNGQFGHCSNDCNKERFCLLCALRDLIMRSLVSNTTVSPWDLVNNLTHISSNFQRYQQEDAHEFLQCFLDRLEGCHEPESKNCKSLQSDNIVQQVFGGRLVSNLKCCNCGHCSDTYEPSIDLSLEIDDADNLFTALHSFTKVEKIEDPETKFTCEKCNERVYVEKKLSFDQAPSVAVFHLKRFENDGSFVQKIDKHVAFPLDLDLQPYTGNGIYNYAELQYVLYAVVVHIGLRPTSGHYYCFIRLSSDMWCKFDDSNVELVHEDYVLSQEAYVLFYAKESTPWFSSFIETQKEFVNSTWNTSPKSVLDNVDTSSVSPDLDNKFGSNEVNYETGSAHEGGSDNEIKDRGSVPNNIKRKASVCDLQEMPSSVSPLSRDSSNMSLPKVQKVSPILLEKLIQNQEVSAFKNCQNDTETPFRSPSPEIYREDSPDARFSISRNHLRTGGSLPCKRRLENMDDQRKHAFKFIQKTMPSSRSQQMIAALTGANSEPSGNRKKARKVMA
ncbi:hypothetical protein C2S51_000482 [Perilla frutescens var. frutescens]|nr:hypothetical protein C2S51_000482 [Perilla frutescens var. frutescens]